MTSRVPSIWPSYKNNTLYFFDDASLNARDYIYPSNYGMIPLNISFSSNTENDTVEYGLDCSSAATTISFERLSNWYYFFNEYYRLLNDYGHCNRTYSSAQEYYRYESNTKYVNQMIYGSDEQTYIDIDEKFNAIGGIVDMDNILTKGATDIGFYKWICDNIIPSYYISKDYSEYWKRNKLFYPDVIKWIAWFSSRLEYEDAYYSAITNDEGEIIDNERWDCRNSAITDCCDCEEYFNRGGKREFDRMLDWYNHLQDSILPLYEFIRANEKCFIPAMIDSIDLHNSLDDLGQYSIFSKDYELGIDYRTAKYGDSANTHGGTVIEISGDTMILKEEYDGFCFSPYYMDKICDENAWENYTDKYMSENPSEFSADNYQYYAFDDNNIMYTGDTTSAVTNAMSSAYTYDIINTDAILIGSTLYDIQNSEYGEYDITNQYMSGKTFFVKRENETSTPYTLVNGKKVYAEWYPYSNPSFSGNPCYYFTFFKTNTNTKGIECGQQDKSFNIANYKPFGRKRSTNEEDLINYITYMGRVFEVSGETLEITEEKYLRIHGYAYDKDGNIMYCIKDDEGIHAIDSIFLDEIPKSKVVNDKIIIGLDYEPHIYNAKELLGRTLSKLTDLASIDVLVDDIGNEIDGRYIIDGVPSGRTYNHQPPEGTELDLLYEVGNTSNIKRFKQTIEDLNTVENPSAATNYFVGNIITDMVFYFKDVSGNIAKGKVNGNDVTTEKKWNGSSLKTIHDSQSARTDLEESGDTVILFDGDDIYCDITYYVGATLSRKEGEPFKLAYSADVVSNNYSYGIEYKETVKFVKENREYYLKKPTKKQIPTTFNSVSAHSISYPIYVYNLSQGLEEIEADEYNTSFYSPLASFKTEINLVSADTLSSNFNEYVDMDARNNLQAAPTFKQEYMIGISSLENIDSDIYIERGINTAFEKHLKLGEITSMEALEQYGLTFFKIIDT